MPETTASPRPVRAGMTLPFPPPRIESEVLDGRWVKTNDKPQWIDSLEIDTVDGETHVHILGSSAPSPHDWGRVRCTSVYASAPDTASAVAGGFIAHYDLDDCSVEVEGNYNLGLLVVATWVTFRAPGPYANRFTREFFFRA